MLTSAKNFDKIIFADAPKDGNENPEGNAIAKAFGARNECQLNLDN